MPEHEIFVGIIWLIAIIILVCIVSVSCSTYTERDALSDSLDVGNIILDVIRIAK